MSNIGGRATGTPATRPVVPGSARRPPSSGDSLWEEVTSDVHLVNPPTTITLEASDSVNIDNTNDFNIQLSNSLSLQAAVDVNLEAGAGATAGDVNINSSTGTGPSTGDIFIVSGRDINATVVRYLRITGLPTVNPGGTGRVWNDSGTLKIT